MPIKYIPYYPNTVEGQAILDNITRTQRVLRYRENNKVYDRIKRGMPYYETELVEEVGNTDTKNLVIRGECISACAYLKDQGIKVDLVYIDPPFASGADYAKKVYIRRNPKLAEKIAIAEQEMEIEDLKAFEEKMYGDIWQKEDYLNWMYENLQAIKSIMSETASIYVHLDWHIGHYVKILMDEVFGEDAFINEIIWAYRSGGASKKASIARKHDAIYFYTNNPNNFQINTIKERQYLEKQFIGTMTDENGRFYVDTILTDTLSGVIYRVLEDGSIKEYSCRPVLNVSKERVDYSTQKPEGLIDMLLEIASKKEMIVADFFGGSGVSAKVANDLGRSFIHVDIGLNSIQTIRDRLIQGNADFKILEIKDGVSLFRNPQQTMEKLAQLIPGLQKNVPKLSNFWFGAILEANTGTVPVYVPNLLNTQEKVLDIPTINKIINQELPNLEIEAKKVIVYYIDIDEPKQLQKFIQDNNATQIEVELKDLKNLLHEIVIEDQITYTLTNSGNEHTVKLNQIVSDRLIQKIEAFNQKGQGKKADLFEEAEEVENEDADEEEATKAKKKKFVPIVISEEGLELIELVSLDCKNQEGEWHSTTEIKIDKLGYVIKDGTKTKAFWDAKISTNQKPLRLKVRNISGDETIIKLE